MEFFRIMTRRLSISSFKCSYLSVKLIICFLQMLFPVRILHFLHTMCARVRGLKRPGRFAVNTIKKLRAGAVQGDSSVRDFHVPKLNFKADSLYNLIDWSGDETVLHEPVLTCGVRTDQLEQYLDKPLTRPDIDCHTQSCERAVKVCFSYILSYVKSNLFSTRKQQWLHPRSMDS